MSDDDYAINRIERLEPLVARLKALFIRKSRTPEEPPVPEKPKARPTGVGGLDWGDRSLYKDPYR